MKFCHAPPRRIDLVSLLPLSLLVSPKQPVTRTFPNIPQLVLCNPCLKLVKYKPKLLPNSQYFQPEPFGSLSNPIGVIFHDKRLLFNPPMPIPPFSLGWLIFILVQWQISPVKYNHSQSFVWVLFQIALQMFPSWGIISTIRMDLSPMILSYSQLL